MTTVSTDDPQFLLAIQACAVALRRLAAYELAPLSQPTARVRRAEGISQSGGA